MSTAVERMRRLRAERRYVKELAKSTPFLDERTAVSIVEAYADLSHSEFAVWIRLLCSAPHELERGRRKISKMLGLSETRSNQILRALRHKRYVVMTPSGEIGVPTKLEIRRRGIIEGFHNFVRLSLVSQVSTDSVEKIKKKVA